MIVRILGMSAAITGVLGLAAPAVRAAPQPTCTQIVALRNFGGGKVTAEELAKRLNTDVETVRNCLDKKPQAAKSKPTTPAPAAN